jgi:hypothetical protein
MTKLFTLILIGIVCMLHAQKPIVKLEVDQTKITLGNELIITVKSNVEGEITINFPSEFVRGYDVMSGMEQEVDYNTGIVNTISYYSQNGSFKKTGTFSIGPAYVKRGKHIFKSNMVQVTVQKEHVDNGNGTVTSKQLKQLAFGVIEVNKTSLYEGEPLIVQAKVYSRFAPTSIEDYQTYKIDQSIDKQALDNAQNLTARKETVKGVGMYVITHDKNLLFPTGSGVLQINPFKLVLRQHFDGLAVVSTGANVNVKPLPNNAPKSFIGFVGSLEAKCQYNGTCDKKGDIIKLELVLTGKGNLHNVDAPKLILSKGLIQFGKPALTEAYSFGAQGAEGKIIYNYTLQSTNNERKEINDLLISYFNPEKEAYVTLTLDGFKSTDVQTNTPITKKGTTTVIKPDNIKKPTEPTTSNKNLITWGILSLGSVLFLATIGLIYLRKKPAQINPSISDTKINKQPTLSPQISAAMLNEQFENAINQGSISDIERIIFNAIALGLNKNPAHETKETLLAELRLLNESDANQLHAWYLSVQQAKYGLNVNDIDDKEMISESKAIYELIKRNYSI